jgi:hypothetical protein
VEAGPSGIGGAGPPTAPALPGPAPATLPPPPIGGFGFPNPAAPPFSVNNEVPALTSPPTLRLRPSAGVIPLQAYDPTAPAILIKPNVVLGEAFTDNAYLIHSPRRFAAITQLGGGLTASVDSPRVQAVATGLASGSVYLPGSNSTLNQVYGNLYANGHGTVYPDLLYIDAQSLITQSTTLPGFGFQNLSTLPRNQQTQQFINNVSPYLIKSFGGVADTELRYTFSSSNYGGNTVVTTSPLTPGLNLASTTLNEGTFIAATGENFQNSSRGSRLTRPNSIALRWHKAPKSVLSTIFNTTLPRRSPRSGAPGTRICAIPVHQRRHLRGPPGLPAAGLEQWGQISRPMWPCNTADCRAYMGLPDRPRSM